MSRAARFPIALTGAGSAGELIPESFGAVGNGVADDTVALQAAFNALDAGDVLLVRSGKIYAHSAVLVLDSDGATVSGPGEIRATAEATSAVQITGDDITVEGVLFTCPTTTVRGDTLTNHKVLLNGCSGVRLIDVRVDGSSAAGILMRGASDYELVRPLVENTRADGIHSMGGSTRGRITGAVCRTTGDDGIAVVSYDSGGDAGLCNDVIVSDFHVDTTTTGRGISVVGGADIEYRDGRVANTYAAGVIVACEPAGQGNDSTDRVLIRNVTVELANAYGAGQPDHGGLLVTNDRASHHINDVRFEHITLTNTRAAASRSISLLSTNGGTADGIVLDDVQVRGTAPATLFFSDYTSTHYLLDHVSGPYRDGWELLNAYTFPGGTATSGALTVSARDELMIVVRILSLSVADIPALRFNADTGTHYQSRYVTCADGGVTMTNVATASTTMARLSGLSSDKPRVIQAIMNDHRDWEKAATVTSRVNTGAVAATPALDVAGGYEWVNSAAQVTSVTLLTVGGANVGGNSQILIFGRDATG